MVYSGDISETELVGFCNSVIGLKGLKERVGLEEI